MLAGSGPARDHSSRVTRRIAQNTVWFSLADAAGKAMTFLFVLVAARHLGVENFGALSFALAYVTMFATLADLGLGVVAAREIARDSSDAQRYVDNALAIRVIISLLLMAAIYFSVQMLGYAPMAVELTRVASFYVLASAVSLLYASVFQGFEKMFLAAAARILQTLILICGALLLTRFTPNAAAFAWLYTAGMLSGAVLSWLLAGRVGIRPGFGLEFRFWRKLLRYSFPIGIAAAFGILYYWSGTALLTRFEGELAAGVFSASFRLVLGCGFLSLGFTGAIYPVASRFFALDKTPAAGYAGTRAAHFATRALRYIVILATGIALLGTFLARPIILTLYGPEYEASIQVLRILAWWGGFMSLNVMLSNLLYAARVARPVTWQTLISLLLSVGISLLLIPRFAETGVAVGLVVAELAGTLFLTVSLVRKVYRPELPPVIGSFIKAAGSALIAGLAGALIAASNPVPGIALSMAVFVLLLVVSGAITSDDRRLIRLVLGRAELGGSVGL